MIPRFSPIMAAWVRSLAPSLESMFADSALDRVLGDQKLGGNLFVRISGGDQPQHLDFRRRQGIIRRMLGKFGGDLRAT